MALPYVRVTLFGELPGGERWSVSPAFRGDWDDPVFGHDELQAAATAIQSTTNWTDYPTLMTFLSSRGSIGGTRVSLYGPDGRLADYAERAASGPINGSGTLALPPTAACALSLYSGIPGRSYRGRIFWPALGATLDSNTGRFRTSDVAELAIETTEMLSDIQDKFQPTRAAHLIVWSSKLQAGTTVREVRVGDLVDSQRGRKDALQDQYASAAYPI